MIDQGARDMIASIKAVLERHEAICVNDKAVQTAAIASLLHILADMKSDNRRDFDAIRNLFGIVTDKQTASTDARFGSQQEVNSRNAVGLAAMNTRMDGKMLNIAYAVIVALGAAVIYMFLKLQHWA
jgi:hypothetical protein